MEENKNYIPYIITMYGMLETNKENIEDIKEELEGTNIQYLINKADSKYIELDEVELCKNKNIKKRRHEMNIEISSNVNEISIENIELLVHSISKEEIKTQNIKRINKCIEKLRETISKSYSKLMIVFDGYNNDSREVYEIEEIRKYVSKLFNENEDLFYFLTNIGQNNKILLICMSDFHKIKNRDSITVDTEYKINSMLKDRIFKGILTHVKNDNRKLNTILENLFIRNET